MTSPPDPSRRLRTTWTHDGFSCEVDGAGSVGPMALLLAVPGLALALAAVVRTPLTVLMVFAAFVAAYLLATRWATATLRPIRVRVRRDRLAWSSGWQPTEEIDLAEVWDVRVRVWGLRVAAGERLVRLFSPSPSDDLAWLADRIREAAATARDVADEHDRPVARRQRAALDALRSKSHPEAEGR